jgi:hypothetical protein
MKLIEVIIYFGYIVLALNTFLFFKSYRSHSVAFKLFSFYLFLTLLIQLLATFIKNSPIKHNLFLSHYYFIGQFILLSLFFKHILKKETQKKIIKPVLIIVLVVLGIYYSIYPSNYYKFNIFEIVITSAPLIIYCFFFFNGKIEDSDKKFIYIVSGFFLYILCSTLLFTAGNIESGTKNIIWYSNAVLYIVYQLLIFVEWSKNFKKPPLIKPTKKQ